MSGRIGGWRLWALAGTALLPTAAGAWDPPPSIPNEQRAPTDADWIRYYLRRQARGCPHCGVELGFIHEPTRYYPCPAPGCGPVHRSFQGQYGIFHPMPYYVPVQPTVVLLNGVCPKCGWDIRFARQKFPNAVLAPTAIAPISSSSESASGRFSAENDQPVAAAADQPVEPAAEPSK